MSTVRVAVTQAHGGIAVMEFVVIGRATGEMPQGAVRSNDPRFWFREPTKSAVDAEIAKTFLNPSYSADEQPVSWRFVDPADLPADRAFRAAWVDTGEAISHDMRKARAIRLEQLRRERAPLFAALDVEVSRHLLVDPERAYEAEKRRQALRDMPSSIAPSLEAAQDIGDLKAIQIPG